MSSPAPLLTICTPTHERPELLRRALESVIDQIHVAPTDVEILVSDNSTSDEPEHIARALLGGLSGPATYVHNRPPLTMVENHNQCLGLSKGRNILFLQDDDMLLPGGLSAILDVLRIPEAPAIHLFGIDVVDIDGRVRRRQRPRRDEVLTPAQALRKLLAESSYIRVPGLVVRSDAYRSVGPFDPEAGNAIDFDMWVRLISRYGIHTVPQRIAAYTVHEGALTTRMFTPEAVATLMRIFDHAVATGTLDRAEVRRRQATWFHQFVLAGARRQFERRDRTGAAAVMRLFCLPEIRKLGPSPRWLPIRIAFSLAVIGARPRGAQSGPRDKH
jgi:glycosyltransferase involved in cell wall biosynthesis